MLRRKLSLNAANSGLWRLVAANGGLWLYSFKKASECKCG
ncbi:hypothetical protein COO91_10435 (plasmid) [Nostoc flagelliforme CCNUN1]|uniref:Uncharacterized protein n=1 Tax=Nostoc flagelliforme CCNUN1 TaxID=2038116 RepID=A0A2K8T958_9NOSO|nr:hypothetical protein COO91_10435 [Nostoc flagelliforme CCNUN1]